MRIGTLFFHCSVPRARFGRGGWGGGDTDPFYMSPSQRSLPESPIRSTHPSPQPSTLSIHSKNKLFAKINSSVA